jgi:hypothetical protein
MQFKRRPFILIMGLLLFTAACQSATFDAAPEGMALNPKETLEPYARSVGKVDGGVGGGTEASAVTSIEAGATAASPPEEPFAMKVDRPFMIVIMDNRTDTFWFVGSIGAPKL